MNTSLPGTSKNLIHKKVLVFLFFYFLSITSFSQGIRITGTDEPLNRILINLRDNYGLMMSFDDRQLSAYKLTLDRNFDSPSQALDYIFKDLPLRYEVRNGVYVIYSVPISSEKSKKYIISGKITDSTNHETLPFSNIIINKTGLISDAKGNFSFISTTDSIFSVKISYLGYYILDTIIGSGLNYHFRLVPSVIDMKEVVVLGSSVERSIQTGTSPGTSHLNHKIAYYLPGYGDNSVFNLLRLQPGILAAGEQSADLIIWGSYEGQSQFIFDGFTMYGMKNFNDNISAVNPYIAKDIKVLKGGFGAEYGEKVGGIIDITGIDGNRLSPSVLLCINNMTLNGLASVPVRKKSAFVLAYRQTYYNLYNPMEFSTSGSGYGRGQQGDAGADYYVIPDYLFRDANLKFSGSGKISNYYLSLYGGNDNFSYSFNEENQQRDIFLDYAEHNLQMGGTLFYGLRWKSKNTSNLKISYSSLRTDRDYIEEITRNSGNHQPVSNVNEQSQTGIHEVNSRIDNVFVLTDRNTLDAGLGLINYFTSLQEGTVQELTSEKKANLQVPYLYIQDHITLFKKLILKPGIRTDFHSISKKLFFQPRFSVAYRINDAFKVNTAFGLYNQFVAKNMIIDTSGNYELNWSLCDNEEVAILNSQSASIGFSYNKNNLTISLEGYLKHTGGITRYLDTGSGTDRYEGEGKTKGLDFFVKKEFRNQTIWISYTLSKTLEHFPYFSTNEYIPAMHDQRHELKLAGLARIKSFHFSANWVFGSGFPDPEQLPDVIDYTDFYSRLDAAAIYNFHVRKIQLDAGFSVLNILNRENIRYSNYTRIPTDEINSVSLYAEAVPVTPTIFLKLYY